jgi:CHAT domain-containing protein
LLLSLVPIMARPVRAQTPDELDALGTKTQTLISAGKYAEAIEQAHQWVTGAERQYGPEHIKTAQALYKLGNAQRWHSDYADAKTSLLRALAIFERESGSRETIEGARVLTELGWTSAYSFHLADARDYFSRSLAAKEKLLDPDDLEISYSLEGLATVSLSGSQYEAANRYGERALSIQRKRLGPESNIVMNSIAFLATVKHKNGELAEATALFNEGLRSERAKSNPNPLRLATFLGFKATISNDKGDFEAAERLSRESMGLLEKNKLTDSAPYIALLNLMAQICALTSRYAEGEVWAKKVIEAYKVVPTVQARDVINATSTLSIIYNGQDRYADAEKALKKAVSLAEETFGELSVDVAQLLDNLAILYSSVGRSAEALELFGRILRIRKAVLPPEHALIGATYASRANVLNALSRYSEAESDARQALRIMEAVYGDKYPLALSTRSELAAALKGEKRYADAIKVYKEAIALATVAEGDKSPRIPVYLHDMGLAFEADGQHAEAEDTYLKSISLNNKGTVSQAQTRKVLADLYEKQAQSRKALESYRAATEIFVDAYQKTAGSRKEYEGGIWLRSTISGHLLALLKVVENPGQDMEAMKESFRISQWLMRTTTSATLSQLGARMAAASGELSQSIRARQDNTQRWQALDAQLDRLISQPIGERVSTRVAALRDEMSKLEIELNRLDKLLADEFPAYTELASPRPVDVDALQKLLRGDEALMQLAQFGKQVIVWVVTRDDATWYSVPLESQQLAGIVVSLRCGLDYEGAWLSGNLPCAELLKTSYSVSDRRSGKPLPLDLARAYLLYKELFGKAEKLIKNKQLLVVPSGVLTQLPFQVLVTREPDPALSGVEALRRASWLIRSHAITVLPSVSSLKAVRQLAKDSYASRALIGFGNPLLDGQPDKHPDDGQLAQRARANESCPKRPSRELASLGDGQRGVRALALRGGIADVAEIRAQAPLPETADELCAVAADLGAGPDDIRLGAHATEAEIKRLSQEGELAKYRIIHFATHGALAGQLGGDFEPGLLLTPPEHATENDDGYLSASEVAALKLDANWAILSACNTAAGGAETNEAFSGLARAFFYAGARALLVSHWAVHSDASVKLITGAISRMAAGNAGRAEAMRQSMLALIDKGAPYEAHPAFWAPFVIVGEGAAPS